MTNVHDVRTASLTWGLFFAGTCAYCLTYQAVVWAVTPDFTHTVSLAMREWGAWLVTTPLVFGALTRSAARPDRMRFRVVVGALAISAAVLVPLAADVITGARTVAASLAIFLPRNAFAFVGVCLVWRVFVRRDAQPIGGLPPTPSTSSTPPTPSTEPAEPALPDALLVSKGADQCLLAVDRIQRVSAAGNYAEVHAAAQMYLMRATLNQIEARLPARSFVRIHRSHIVRVEEIERIRVQRSSSGVVTLRDGSTLPMSKRYRTALQRLRVPVV